MTRSRTLPNDPTGDALQRLIDTGSDLSQPMRMDFFVAVPTAEVGEEVARHAQRLGYETSVWLDDETGVWTCTCTRTLVPTYDHVCTVEAELDAIGQEYGGYVDGFGSWGNAEAAAKT